MKTFPEWDRVVLEHTYEAVDYLSMHRYYQYDETRKRPLEDFLGSADDMNEYIGTLKATIEYVRAKVRSKRHLKISFDEWNHLKISFDEWNIWTVDAPRTEPLWKKAPHLLEDVYTFRDALVFAGLMNTLLNNCDVVKIGCLAQLVNVIAPIMTKKGGGTFKQASFYPFRYLAGNASGATVRTFSLTATPSKTCTARRAPSTKPSRTIWQSAKCAFLSAITAKRRAKWSLNCVPSAISKPRNMCAW